MMGGCDWNEDGDVDCDDIGPYLSQMGADWDCDCIDANKAKLICCFMETCVADWDVDDIPSGETKCDDMLDCALEQLGGGALPDEVFDCIVGAAGDSCVKARCLITPGGTPYYWLPDPVTGDFECDQNDDGNVNCDDLKRFFDNSIASCNFNVEYTSQQIIELACLFVGYCPAAGWDLMVVGKECETVVGCIEDFLGRPLTPDEVATLAAANCVNEPCVCCTEIGSTDTFFFDCDGTIDCDQNGDGTIDCADLTSFVDKANEGCQDLSLDKSKVLDLLCAFAAQCAGADNSSLCVGLTECANAILASYGHAALSAGEAGTLSGVNCADCPEVCKPTDESGQSGQEGGPCPVDTTSSTLDSGSVDVNRGDLVYPNIGDLDVVVNGMNFSLGRQYNSNPDYESSCAGPENWSVSAFAYVDDDGFGNLSLNLGARGNIVVDISAGGGPWDVPGPTSQVVKKTSVTEPGSEYAVWQVEEPGQWTMEFWRENVDPDELGGNWVETPDAQIGLLRRTFDEYDNPHNYVYAVVGDDPQGDVRLQSVYVNGDPEGSTPPDAKIIFNYILDGGDNNGFVRRVTVQRFDTNDDPVAVQYVEYTYKDSATGVGAIGTDGDLIQVAKYERLDPPSGAPPSVAAWRERIWQYRYHDETIDPEGGTDVDGDGFDREYGNDHQLKMVIEPEQIEFATEQWNVANDPAHKTLSEFASFLLGKGDEIVLYGSTIVADLASVVVEEYEDDDPASDKYGRVLTQYLQSACGCGGGGGGVTQGIKFQYTYTDRDASASTAETIRVDESKLEGASYAPYRKHYYEIEYPDAVGIPYLGTKVVEELGASPLQWVTDYDYNGTTHTVARMFTPSSINSYDPAMHTVDFKDSDGLVYEYTYTTEDNRLAETKVKKGNLGTLKLVTKTVYGDDAVGDTRFHLPNQTERYRVEGVETGELNIEKTFYAYKFHGGSGDDIQWIEIKVEAEEVAENGPDGDYLSYEVYDTVGNNHWSIAADDSYTKRVFDVDESTPSSRTGRVVQVIRNSDNMGFPTITGFTPPGDRNADGKKLITQYKRDLLGRVRERITPGLVSSYTLREMRDYPGRNELQYYAQITLPHEFIGESAGVDYDAPATISWYNADDDVIGASDFPIGANGYVFPQTVPEPGYHRVLISYDLDGDEESENGRLARTEVLHDVSGLVTASRVWHVEDETNSFYETSYTYDGLGRVVTTTNGVDTITRNTYDVLDRVIKVELGTDAGSPGDMVDVAAYIYDGSGSTQGSGNGNLTRVTQFVDAPANDRDTDNSYDWRDRLITITNPLAPHVSIAYDNLDRVIKRSVYSAAPPDDPDITTNRERYVQSSYSQRGLVYRTALAITPGSASPDFLETHTWYDEVGRSVGSWAPNGPGTKTTYDGLGRPDVTYTTDRGGDADPGAIGNHADVYDTTNHEAQVDGDVVLQQMQYSYIPDGASHGRHYGQLDLVTTYRRTHDALDSNQGDLADFAPLNADLVITTYVGSDYDDADRVIRSINFGTDQSTDEFKYGGPAPSKQASPNDDDWDISAGFELVTATTYNTRGLVDTTTSPDDEDTKYFYDDLNRRIAVFENFINGTIAWDPMKSPPRWVATGVGDATDKDDDRATSFVHDAISNVVIQTAHQPLSGGADDQLTEYKYGVTDTDDPGASELASNDLLRQVIYPDIEPSETDPNHSVYYAYNRAGELIFTEDQNTTEHTYTRDKLGRVTKDDATDLGTSIDGAIRAITTDYTLYGLVEFVKSLDSGATVQNAVKFEYNGLWQVTKVHQENNGNVVVGTTLKVQYTYDTNDMDTGNFSRMQRMTYPDGKLIDHNYGVSTGSDWRISRPKGIDDGGFSTGDMHAGYDYIGLSMFAQVDYEKIDVQLDRTASHGGRRQTQGNTDNLGLYPGYDRFGRVVRQTWVDGDFTEHGTANPDYGNYPPIVELAYTYDKDSNRTAAYDDRPGAVQTLSHEYAYDGVDRLKEAKRGSWDGSTFTAGLGSQRWTLDMLGNWNKIETNEDTAYGYEADEADNRDHDDPSDANELDQRTLVGQGSGGADLALDFKYDNAGNLLSEERQSGTNSVNWAYTHDAWNRLVKVTKPGIPTPKTISLSKYNGLNWMILKQADTNANGLLDEQRMRYYSANWQLLEERIDDESTFTDDPTDPDIDRHVQYVWGQRYIDDLILHREDGDVNGIYDDTWYHLSDVQYSTVAILDNAAALVERVSYDAYGDARHHYMADWKGDGDVTQAEIDQINTVAGGANHAIGEANYNPDMDIDRNGDVQTADYTIANTEGIHSALAKGLLSDPSVDNQIGWDGYVFNSETQIYTVRFRSYRPVLGRWLERDFLVYIDGMNMYESVRSNPLTRRDAYGLDDDDETPTGTAEDLDKWLKDLTKNLQNVQTNQRPQGPCKEGDPDITLVQHSVSPPIYRRIAHFGPGTPKSQVAMDLLDFCASVAWTIWQGGKIGKPGIPIGGGTISDAAAGQATFWVQAWREHTVLITTWTCQERCPGQWIYMPDLGSFKHSRYIETLGTFQLTTKTRGISNTELDAFQRLIAGYDAGVLRQVRNACNRLARNRFGKSAVPEGTDTLTEPCCDDAEPDK